MDSGERERHLRLLRHLEACLLEIELKRVPVPADVPVSIKGKFCANSRPKSRSSVNKAKPAPKVRVAQEPPLVRLNEPLDYSVSKAAKSMETVNEPIAKPSTTHADESNMTPQLNNNMQMSEFFVIKPATRSDMQLIFPTTSATEVSGLPRFDSPMGSSRCQRFVSDVNENAMDDTEWRFKELRKVLLNEPDSPPESAQPEEDVKPEMVKFEDFDDVSARDYGNMDVVEEAIDIKAQLDDPMWRPWT
ncbi:uncharacterized protein LOC143920764 [Arctopsyche grandis]|uniref:uncharacterized protein LOC143920764 n=1 Tax=Arctopsyche grandis TaxID=121162 RepID=UPI00406D9216